jgi:hypothetical protein
LANNRRAKLPAGCLVVAVLLIVFNFAVAYLIVSGLLETWLGR